MPLTGCWLILGNLHATQNLVSAAGPPTLHLLVGFFFDIRVRIRKLPRKRRVSGAESRDISVMYMLAAMSPDDGDSELLHGLDPKRNIDDLRLSFRSVMRAMSEDLTWLFIIAWVIVVFGLVRRRAPTTVPVWCKPSFRDHKSGMPFLAPSRGILGYESRCLLVRSPQISVALTNAHQLSPADCIARDVVAWRLSEDQGRQRDLGSYALRVSQHRRVL